MTKNQLNRRKFISHSCSAGLTSTAGVTIGSSLLNLCLSRSIAAQSLSGENDYRALVCILLAGGNDSFNMLVPTVA